MESHREELVRKITAHVAERYGGDYRRAFDSQDLDRNGRVSRSELLGFLTACGVGTFATRSLWADAVLAELDLDRDGGISFEEFSAALPRGGG